MVTERIIAAEINVTVHLFSSPYSTAKRIHSQRAPVRVLTFTSSVVYRNATF